MVQGELMGSSFYGDLVRGGMFAGLHAFFIVNFRSIISCPAPLRRNHYP